VGEMKSAYRILVEKPEWKLALGRPTSIRGNNIKIDLREIGWRGSSMHATCPAHPILTHILVSN
jgi:hypothetical protein